MRELSLVDEMRGIAEASRYDMPTRAYSQIVEWIDANMCPVLSELRATDPAQLEQPPPARLHRIRRHAPLA